MIKRGGLVNKNVDTITTIQNLKDISQKFVQERSWQRYHDPKNLSMALVAEAAELMEIFLWTKNEQSYEVLEKNRNEVENEIADIAFVLVTFCQEYGIDLAQAFERKMLLTAQKYPIKSP
jgi:dCTP diphosphatase